MRPRERRRFRWETAVLRQPHTKLIEKVARSWLAWGPGWNAVEKPQHKEAAADLFGASSPEEHLEWARALASTAVNVRCLETSVEFARAMYDELGSQITCWRKGDSDRG